MPIKFSLEKYINPVFIETGTFGGDGVKKALEAGFEKIYSIEINEKYYKNAMKQFEKEIKEGRVNLILGDSVVCLPKILKNINCKATFWLDAHYSGGKTGRGSKDVPLLEELNAIAEPARNTHTILMDDVRLFGTEHSQDWSDVRLEKIITKLKSINKDYSISYEDGEVKNDVLVAEMKLNDAFIYFTWISASGGTFIWQILRTLFPSEDIYTAHEWVRTDKPVIITYRDLRDKVASAWRRRWGEYDLEGKLVNSPTFSQIRGAVDGVQRSIKDFNKCKIYYKNKKNILWLKYEDFYNNYELIFSKLEKFLNIKISHQLKQQAIKNSNIEKNTKRADIVRKESKRDDFRDYNAKNKIHSRHIYNKGKPGAWKEVIPKQHHSYLNEVLKENLEKWGYKND